MNRLTQKIYATNNLVKCAWKDCPASNGDYDGELWDCDTCTVMAIANKLSAYEDTGLTPDEIKHPPMISVEGYRAFHGTMRITPKCSVPPFTVTADWLYKPEYDCWYGGGHSYPANICEVEQEVSK